MNKIRIAVTLLVISLWMISCSDNPSSPPEPSEPSEPVGSIPDVVEPDVTIEMPGTKISQLVGDYDREKDEPTQNRTYERYQLLSTDLGVPFRHGGRTYVLFGDTHGAGPPDGDAIAYSDDTDPEDGLELTFIDDEGTYKPISISSISQGAFEVPMEGISIDDKMYIYHTTDHKPSLNITMGRSVLARSDDAGESFTYLYDLSTRSFINVSVVKVNSSDWEFLPGSESEEGLVIFGSGTYRESNVYLAYQPASGIEDLGTIRYFAGVDDNGEPLWDSREANSVPLFEQPCVGELSVSYNEFIERWILLYNCGDPRGINVRTAEFPWGPWTKPLVIFHPWDDGGYCHYIHASWQQYEQCDNVHDPGRENEWGGEYGPYQFEHFATGDSLSTTIYFTMSTWNPYTVVLMKARLQREGGVGNTRPSTFN